ncbi:MAG: polyprenyl synthetase family protein [Verrucomicrobia bacterium]|nr:polyprenyl synthetase family protein [Verrucomicrobiota bacterium]
MKDILALVEPHLREVDAAIHRQCEAFDPAISGYVAYALGSSGKRLRPALALLVGGATVGVTSRHVDLAVILEMIHLATLVHDDIMDGADTRRGQPTPNARWGNAITVLLGDCLFAHALDLATNFDDAEISRKIARAATAVCTGEILQTQRRFDLNLSHADYFRIIELKTAALFACAAELGVLVGKGDPAVAENLRQFGLKLGTAYQIYDDCLDLAGDEDKAGKTLGTDLKKGKLTLPLLDLLRDAPPADLAVYSQMILRAEDPESIALTAAVRRSGSLKRAIATAVELIEDARVQLAVLPPSPYGEALHAIAQKVSEMIQRFGERPA